MPKPPQKKKTQNHFPDDEVSRLVQKTGMGRAIAESAVANAAKAARPRVRPQPVAPVVDADKNDEVNKPE